MTHIRVAGHRFRYMFSFLKPPNAPNGSFLDSSADGIAKSCRKVVFLDYRPLSSNNDHGSLLPTNRAAHSPLFGAATYLWSSCAPLSAPDSLAAPAIALAALMFLSIGPIRLLRCWRAFHRWAVSPKHAHHQCHDATKAGAGNQQLRSCFAVNLAFSYS